MQIAVADTNEAYSNTKDGTSCENGNAIDLLTFFSKSHIPGAWSGIDFISEKFFFD